jgi:hypothetical protein
MFKSIISWYARFRASQFLAEGESQIKYQEDVGVKAALPDLPENVLTKSQYLGSSLKGEEFYLHIKLGVDTFSLYGNNNELLDRQLNVPVATLLRVIKQAFDDGGIYFPTRDLETRTVTAKYRSKRLLDLVFSTESSLLRFSNDLVYTNCPVRFPESLNFLTQDEHFWISQYFHYRLKTLCEENEEKRRAATELELQELLK